MFHSVSLGSICVFFAKCEDTCSSSKPRTEWRCCPSTLGLKIRTGGKDGIAVVRAVVVVDDDDDDDIDALNNP